MKKPSYNLIIADDDSVIRDLLSQKATYYGYKPALAENGKEVLELVHDGVDLILLDLHMPVMDGYDCLQRLTKENPDIPVIILTELNEASAVMRAVKLGAHDYITKPFDLNQLFTILRNAKKLCAIKRENQTLKACVEESSTPTDIIAMSQSMQDIVAKAKHIAGIDSSVLLTGESGTGKGVLARYIHANSPRADKPFITVSCPALPRELLESELFGHEKGAFTGALRRKIGKVEAANGGTLFLDEIGDLSIDLQPKLLNVLQDKQFHRIGGEESISSDVRIITATNVDFKEKIENREFREDLYYRISVIPIELPPLRMRPQEIEPLTRNFLHRISKQRQCPEFDIDSAAIEKLKGYHWPGNVRQLENLIERASAFCNDYNILAEDLVGDITNAEKKKHDGKYLAGMKLAEVEKLAIEQTLDSNNGNKAESARMLGISEKSIYNKMSRLGIQ